MTTLYHVCLQDLNAHEDRVAEVNSEANTLVEEGHPETDTIKGKQQVGRGVPPPPPPQENRKKHIY